MNSNQWQEDLYDPSFEQLALEIPKTSTKNEKVRKTKRVKESQEKKSQRFLEFKNTPPNVQIQEQSQNLQQQTNQYEYGRVLTPIAPPPRFQAPVQMQFQATPVSRTSSTESNGSDSNGPVRSLISLINDYSDSSFNDSAA